jgi:tetraacyldisaccharide 4'-kinase
MRAEWESKLTEIWYGDKAPPVWLSCLSPLYRLASHIDKRRKTKQKCEDLSASYIIIVGNITAGGSGKTPLVIRLCHLLQQAGLRPGVISRGYGRKLEDLRLVSPASSSAEVGDEPLLISRRTSVPVMVAADRCEAARALLKQKVNVIVSDDGLQHHRLPRNVEICVVDGSRGFGNGRLIPAGPLREPISRLSSIDHVIVNGESGPLGAGIDFQPMSLAAGMLRSLDGGLAWRLSQFKGCTVNAVAAIGNPQRFFRLLAHSGIKVIEHVFADHHEFTERDFEPLNPDFPILMTEKDAVKCTALGLENAWFLCVDAVLPSAWENELVREALSMVDHAGSLSRIVRK